MRAENPCQYPMETPIAFPMTVPSAPTLCAAVFIDTTKMAASVNTCSIVRQEKKEGKRVV
jgi:hypothetical protein